MKRLSRIRLHHQKVVDYICQDVELKTEFSKYIIENVNFEDGIFFVDLPEESHFDRVYDFKTGGITLDIDLGAEKVENAEGNLYSPRFFLSTDYEIADFIHKYLTISSKHYGVIDEQKIHPQMKCIDIEGIRSIEKNDEFYYILSGENSCRKIEQTIRRVFCAWRSFAVLYSNDKGDNIRFPEVLEGIKYIIVGAYDGEAYIVWQKNSAP